MVDRAYGRNYGRVPDELLWDKAVSDRACRLYAALTRYAQQRDRVVPPRPQLAERLGWSVDKLDRTIGELEGPGALFVERHPGVKGQSRTRESTYWLDGARPDGDPSRNSAARAGRDSAAYDSRSSAATSKKKETSPNGDGGKASKRDGRADTIVGKCVEALRSRPLEIGAFTKIVADAEAEGISPDLIVRQAREWERAAEPVAYLRNRIGQAHREVMARRNGGSRTPATAARHDGKHDRSCWCWEVPEDQRAKVQRGDLLRAAGLEPELASDSGTVPEARA